MLDTLIPDGWNAAIAIATVAAMFYLFETSAKRQMFPLGRRGESQRALIRDKYV